MSLPTSLRERLQSNSACPLCGSAGATPQPSSPTNLYSEKLSQLLACSEAELLEAVANRECARCGLWYKSHALPAQLAQHLFREVVPDHPKGWDAGSPRFSPNGFDAALGAFGSALGAGTTNELGRARRELASIIDSLVELAGTPLRAALLSAVEAGDLATLSEAGPRLRALRWEPWPYKRFCGFGDPALWQWFESILGVLRRYGEVGCPRWGFLLRQPSPECDYLHLLRPESHYWGGGCGCRRDGRACGEASATVRPVGTVEWGRVDDNGCDLIGAFQYLDHVSDPLTFLREALTRSRALALVLDAVDQPTAIQHFHGWNLRSLGYAAEVLGARLEHGFTPIRTSGNDVYLLRRGVA